MKYRKKPVIEIPFVEAVIFNGKWFTELPQWLTDALQKIPGTDGSMYVFDGAAWICTATGELKAVKGDYIVKGFEGEIFKCSKHDFENTYEILNSFY